MKVRLTGTRAETTMTAEFLRKAVDVVVHPARYRVREVSAFYPNRGDSELGRVYLEVDVQLTEGTAGDPR